MPARVALAALLAVADTVSQSPTASESPAASQTSAAAEPRQSSAPSAAALPEGAGREIAAKHCLGCHDSGRLVTPGYSRGGWQEVIGQMMKLGVVLGQDEHTTLLDYLARSFPPQSQPTAQLLPGPTQVSFREWSVATPGAFPHDPLATADG
ncbi:MAG: hypothetical protein JOZ34_04590, partial [Gammaproteobacteria bacterium]|nr:hypothetical protein [Gammaproteobacteria bacterium]